MNFFTASIELTVKSAKMKTELHKAEAAAKKTAREAEKQAKRVMKAVEKAHKDSARAQAKAAKAAERAHAKMVKNIKRHLKNLNRSLKKSFTTAARYAKYVSAAIIGVGVACTKLAMDAEESENLFIESMGNMADAARQWSIELSDSLHMNEYEIRKNIGTFNVMFLSMGHGTQAAYDMATGLTQLSYDMASFYNLKPEEAFQKIRSGIVGMSRPLKDLGILLDETTIKQYALNNGIGDGVRELTQIEKVQARYGALMEQTTKSQGDMKRTLDSTTNVFRSIWGIVKELAIEIGKKLLPAVTKIGIKMRDWLVENKEQVIEWAGVWIKWIEKVINKLWNLIDIFRVDYKKGIGIIKDETILVLTALVDIFLIAGYAAGKAFMKGLSAWMFNFDRIKYEYTKMGGEMKVKLWGWAEPKDKDAWAKATAKVMEKQRKGLKEGLSLGTQIAEAVKPIGSAFAEAGSALDILNKKLEENLVLLKEARADADIKGLSKHQESGIQRKIKQLVKERQGLLEQVAARTGAQAIHKPITVGPSPGIFGGGGVETILSKPRDFMEGFEPTGGSLADMEAMKYRNQLKLDLHSETLAKKLELTQSYLEKLRQDDDLSTAAKIERIQTEMDAVAAQYGTQSELYKKLADEQAAYDKTNIKNTTAMKVALKSWYKETMNWGKQLGNILTGAVENFSSTLATALVDGINNWKDFAKNFIKQILAMIVQLAIAAALMLILNPGAAASSTTTISTTMAAASSMGGLAGSMKTGGHIGKTGLYQMHQGEKVLTKSQQAAPPAEPWSIVINNPNVSGLDIEAEVDEQEHIVEVMIGASKDGRVRQAYQLS